MKDAVLAATRRYAAMTTRDRARALPAAAWSAIADRLDSASALVTGDSVVFVRDRARDAGHRAICAIWARDAAGRPS